MISFYFGLLHDFINNIAEKLDIQADFIVVNDIMQPAMAVVTGGNQGFCTPGLGGKQLFPLTRLPSMRVIL